MYMKNAEQSNYEKILIYQNFIKECKTKIYDSGLVLHKHHIIPKCMWNDGFGDVDGKDNIVMLSVEDHGKAHFLCGNAYDSNTYEHVSNMRSSRILNSKSIRDVDSMKTIRESYMGEKNPFYGKSHSDETRKKLSEKTSNILSGLSYAERYGENRKSIEKEKRRIGVKKCWENMSIVDRDKRNKNISNALLGKALGAKNGFASPITVDGIHYGSISDAVRHLNKSKFLLFKNHTVIKIKK